MTTTPEMTDERALDDVRHAIRHSPSLQVAYDHIAARLRGVGAQPEQQLADLPPAVQDALGVLRPALCKDEQMWRALCTVMAAIPVQPEQQGQAVACHLCDGGVKRSRTGSVWCEACNRTGYRPQPVGGDVVLRARQLLCDVVFPNGGVGADLMLDVDMPQRGVVPTESALAAIRAALSTHPAPSAPSEPELIARGVEHCVEEGDGFWRPCSGCHETVDGYNVGGYPYSTTFRCTLGGGCRECGGLGAMWDATDYASMAEEMSGTTGPAPSEQMAASVAVPEGLSADLAAAVALDDRAWAISKQAEEAGAERCEDENSTSWILRIEHFKALAAAPVAPQPEAAPKPTAGEDA